MTLVIYTRDRRRNRKSDTESLFGYYLLLKAENTIVK